MNRMFRLATIVCTLAAVCSLSACTNDAPSTSSQWKDLFDGSTLNGWDGNPDFWSVTDGAITGATTAENTTDGHTYIVFVGDNADNLPVEFSDFELQLEYRIVGNNSGVQYRSFKVPGQNDGWRIGGYQADIDVEKKWVGTNYGENSRGTLAKRGERATVFGVKTEETSRGKREIAEREVESIGDPAALAEKIKDAPRWNELHIIARGNHLIQKINGVTMSELIDEDKENRRDKGLIAIQLHEGPPMTIQVRNIRIRELARE